MNRWPILYQKYLEKQINYSSYLFAEKLLPDGNEKEAEVLATLFEAVQNGHLCIRCPENILPKTIVGSKLENKPLIFDHGSLYLTKHFILQQTVFNDVQAIASSPPITNLNTLEDSLNGLNAAQKKAVEHAVQSSLTFITGGPGTGKTYTAGKLIALLSQCSLKITLTAPTGKAANNLQESIKKWSPVQNNFETLHALLGIGKENVRDVQIDSDLIIVDECSMIDAEIMYALFRSIKKGTRVVLMGDPNQLPPVESGALFKDLLFKFKQHVVQLETCVRTEGKELIEAGLALLNQTLPAPSETVVFSELNQETLSAQTIRKKILDKTVKYFPYTSQDETALFQAFNQFRILSPLKKGPLGVDQINQSLYTLLKTKALQEGKAHFAAPIIICKNAPQLSLVNGEVGVLIQKATQKESTIQKGDNVLFADGRKIPALILPRFEYAYALSIHKSQGSEFQSVLILLPEGSEYFGREIFYTAVTRAKYSVEIWADPPILKKIINTSTDRSLGVNRC